MFGVTWHRLNKWINEYRVLPARVQIGQVFLWKVRHWRIGCRTTFDTTHVAKDQTSSLLCHSTVHCTAVDTRTILSRCHSSWRNTAASETRREVPSDWSQSVRPQPFVRRRGCCWCDVLDRRWMRGSGWHSRTHRWPVTNTKWHMSTLTNFY